MPRLLWVGMIGGGVLVGAIFGTVVCGIGLIVAALADLVPDGPDLPPEHCVGVVAGLGALLGVFIAWRLLHAASVQRGRAAPWHRATVLVAAVGAFLGASVSAYRVEADYCGPDGASNVDVRLRFTGVVIHHYWARRSWLWPGFEDDCEGAVAGAVLGAVAGALVVASGAVL